MSQLSPSFQRLYQYELAIYPTFDLLFDGQYGGLPNSQAGRPTLPFWEFLYVNQLFPPLQSLSVLGTPAGSQVIAVAACLHQGQCPGGERRGARPEPRHHGLVERLHLHPHAPLRDRLDHQLRKDRLL